MSQQDAKDTPKEILKRMVGNRIKQDGQKAGQDQAVPFGKLIELASKREKCMLCTGWFFACLTGVILPSFIWLIGDVFDSFAPDKDPEETRDKVREMFSIMLGLCAGISISATLQSSCLAAASTRIAGRIKTKYLEAILKQESAWFDMINYTELSSRIEKECQSIQKAMGEKFGQIIFSLSMSLSGLTLGFLKGWSLALAICAIGPMFMIGGAVFTASIKTRILQAMKAYGQSAGFAEQSLQAIRVVVAFGMEKTEMASYNKFLSRVQQQGGKADIFTGCSLGFFLFAIYAAYSYAFLMGGIWVNEGIWNHANDRPYQAGDSIAVFFGVLFGLFALSSAGPSFNAVAEGKAAGKLAFEVIDRIPAINQDSKTGIEHKLEGLIRFENVDFFYPSRPETKVLKEFTHTFEAGKTTAIVGPSGSGKSTVVQLVERFYEPTAGDIYVDDKLLSKVKLRELRQQIGYVPQEPILFNTTIKKNILMGKPEATDDEIIDALKKTNAWDFVSKRGGINSNVGAGGSQLSGGEKQRIALARAFIKKPKLLIFDEATSALDKNNEAEVQRAIEDMKKELGNVTSIVIAHRLSTIRQADTILVLKQGKLVEQGDHDSLRVLQGGIYAKLVAIQEQAEKSEHAKIDQATQAVKIDAKLGNLALPEASDTP